MEIRLPASVESVVALETDESGRTVQLTKYKKKKKKKRRSTVGLGQAEAFLRRLAEAQQSFVDSYLARHNSSHRKKRDGWLLDSPKNVFRATEKGLDKLIS